MTAVDSQHRRTREELAALGLRPRRGLGQNFLVAPRVAERIVASAGVAGRVVVEIGPGMGALSEKLARVAAELFLVEIDHRLAVRLSEGFAGAEHVHVVTADALAVDYGRLLAGRDRAVVVANLPYSVGSQILLRLIEAHRSIERLVLMLQREVAERLVARPGSKAYGTLTIWTSLYGRSRQLFRVAPASFVPRPKVESAVVSITLDTAPRVAIAHAERFRELVRGSFGQRRKMLRSSLAGLASAADFERAGIDPRRRGETLSLEEFAALADGRPASDGD
jgi:16S rRNA (adenine1518-N6/adenine1519-N6)-dimethyltransferase